MSLNYSEEWASHPSPIDPRLSAADGGERGGGGGISNHSNPKESLSLKNASVLLSSTCTGTKVYSNFTLSSTMANMRLASSTFTGPIIPDAAREFTDNNNNNSDQIKRDIHNTGNNGRTTAALVPFLCDVYSFNDLDAVPLLQLYHRSCSMLGIKPNKVVERQLPSTTEHRPYLKINILDFSKTYLGPAGCAAVVPIISACRRLSHLNLEGVGLSYAVALTLIERLRDHPSVRVVNLNNNDLGTTVGERLLRLVLLGNKRIYSLSGEKLSAGFSSSGVDTSHTDSKYTTGKTESKTISPFGDSSSLQNTLIIPAIKKKIDAALAKNYFFRMEYAPDPLALLAAEQQERKTAQQGPKGDDVHTAALLVSEDDALRACLEKARNEELTFERAKQLFLEKEEKETKGSYQQQLPVWFPVAAAELCSVLNRQQEAMNDVMAVFASAYRSSTAVSSAMKSKEANGEDNYSYQQEQQETLAVNIDVKSEKVSLRAFQHAMRVFNVSSLMGCADRCALFLEAFDALELSLHSELDGADVIQHTCATVEDANSSDIEAYDPTDERHAIGVGGGLLRLLRIIGKRGKGGGSSMYSVESFSPTSEAEALAALSIGEQLKAKALPMNEFYHIDQYTRSPSFSSAPLLSSRTRILSEEHKDMLIANVPKVINALRVHSRYLCRPSSATTCHDYHDHGAADLDRIAARETATESTSGNKEEGGSSEGRQQEQHKVQQEAFFTLERRVLRLQQWLFTLLSDRIYDARKEIYECAALLDLDNNGAIYFHELCSGIASVVIVHLFSHRKDILRYMKLIRAIEKQISRAEKRRDKQEQQKQESIDDEEEDIVVGGDLDQLAAFVERFLMFVLDRAARQPEGATALNPMTGRPHSFLSMPRMSTVDATHVGIVCAPSNGEASASKERCGESATERIDKECTKAEDGEEAQGRCAATPRVAIEAFALVPYRELFGGGDAAVFWISDSDVIAHKECRCDPKFWAHATREALRLLTEA